MLKMKFPELKRVLGHRTCANVVTVVHATNFTSSAICKRAKVCKQNEAPFSTEVRVTGKSCDHGHSPSILTRRSVPGGHNPKLFRAQKSIAKANGIALHFIQMGTGKPTYVATKFGMAKHFESLAQVVKWLRQVSRTNVGGSCK